MILNNGSRPQKMNAWSAVNFINVNRTIFLYEHWFQQLFSSYMYVAKTTFVRKILTFNIDEIDTWFKNGLTKVPLLIDIFE